MGNNRKKRGSWKRTSLTVLCVVLSVILVVLIMGMAYIESRLGMINRVNPSTQGTMSPDELASFLAEQTNDTGFTGETIDPSDVTWSTDPVDDPIQGENIINIMLIGQDRRPGEIRARSDAMILCTINKKTKTLTMTSFMRDLYVPIPGIEDNRINVSYFVGGMEMLDSCLKNNFGVEVDGNIEVDFNGFMEAIDLVGGIDIELNQSEANYLNMRGNWEVTNEMPWNLTAGMNHLTGSQALAYSRIRMVGNGDFERTSRQRKVLSILLEKCKSLNLIQLDKLLTSILPLLTTDLTDAQILGYVREVFPILSQLKVVSQRIPADGTYRDAYVREMAVLIPDLEANRQLLAESLKGEE